MTKENYERISELLTRLPSETFKEFVHRCIDEICGRKGPNKELFCFSEEWKVGEYTEAQEGLKAFLISVVIHQYDKRKIEDTLSLSGDRLQALITCLSVRNVEVREVLLDKIVRTPGVNLQDFDWKLKWIQGTSSLSSLQEPVLQLDLLTKEQNLLEPLHKSLPTTLISIELKLNDLSSMINALEVANENLN